MPELRHYRLWWRDKNGVQIVLPRVGVGDGEDAETVGNEMLERFGWQPFLLTFEMSELLPD